MTIGILVHGSNHFIVEGPLPSLDAARKLVRLWEIPRIEPAPPLPWRVITRAFRENLEWAVVLEGDSLPQVNVAELVGEVRARGVEVHRGPGPLLGYDARCAWSGCDWPVVR
ncbi:MAG: hypothetical protein U0Q16_18175 [Bryobacteraceae bacterium]